MRRILILRPFVALALLFCVQFAQAQVTLILNTPPQLPERVNDWERLNALFSVTVTNTGATPLARLRIAATVTNMDNNAVLFRTKNDLTRPFNAPPRIPQTLTAPQILPANSFEYDASVQTALIRTNTLPEGAYRLCVRVIDERGTTLGMEQCRTFNVVIPDPPSLISPVNGDSVRRMAPSIPIAPNFQWTQVFARFGQQSKYKLRVVPIFEGQQPRQALEGNPVLLEKIIQTSSYLWLPSDPRFDNYPNAKGFVWQVQAIDPNDVSIANVRAVGRNEGKSEIFTFGTPVPQSNVTSGEVLGPGSEITIGEFILKLGKDVNDVTKNTDGTITGKGTIAVNWLKQAVNLKQASFTINVEFKGITVENKKVTKGEVYATVTAPMKTFKEQLKDKANLPTVPDNVNISLGSDGSNLKQIEDNAKNALNNLLNGAISLPIGYQKDENSLTISIVGMKFTPVKAVINAMVRVPTPSFGEGAALALGAGCIPFTSTGPDPTKAMKLFLMEDFKVSQTYDLVFNAPVGDNDQNPNGTFAEFDKMSLKKFMIAGTVAFPTGWFTKVSDGTAVTGTFSGTSESLTAWVVSASIPDECLIPKLPDFKLKINNISLDMSDKKNPDGLTFPKDYPNGVDWRGFAIQKATLTLPPYLKQFGSNKPLTLELLNFLIDGNGLSGTAQMAQKTDSINFGGFKGSLDTFKLSFIKMSPEEVSVAGTMTLPVGDATIGIIGTFATGGGMSLAATLTQDKKFDIAGGFFTLSKGTNLVFKKEKGQNAVATATLNGSINLNKGVGASLQGEEMSFSGISFQGLTLSPLGESPLKLGTWSRIDNNNQTKAIYNGKSEDINDNGDTAPSQPGFGGFPLTIESLELEEDNDGKTKRAKLGIQLNLDGSGNESLLSGETKLVFSFEVGKATSSVPMSITFKDMTIESISITADLPAVQISGLVSFYNNNPVYGKGFYGALDAAFIDSAVTAKAAAQFGRKGDIRYWFVDASVGFANGIQMPPLPAMSFYGFGGGVWKNMKPEGTPSDQFPESSSEPPPMAIGKTYSGLKLIPAAGGLGLQVNADIGTSGDSSPFNAKIQIEATFINGGLSALALKGDSYFMTSIGERRNPKNTNLMYGGVDFKYDFPNKTFTGTGGFYVNVPPPKGAVFKADATFDLLFSPVEWHVFIGTPENRVQYELFSALQAGGYVMIGNNIKPPAVPPTEVTSVLGGVFPPRAPELSKGSGFAFGINQKIDIPKDGRLQYLIFYAKFSAGWGFDVSLLRYKNVTCKGESELIGVNGWYADGQIYAYMTGAIGLHVDLWLVEGDFEILKVAAAAALQAKLPNPSWAKGAVGGTYSILDGLVEGNCRFEFEVGKKCEFENKGNPLEEIELIADVQPKGNSEKVSVFIRPSVIFSMKVNQAFTISALNSQGEPSNRTFRFLVDAQNKDFPQTGIRLWKKSGNSWKLVSSDISYFGNNTFALNTSGLEPYSKYRLEVAALGQELISGNGWQNVKDKNGDSTGLVIESYEFTTGDGPTSIQEAHVVETSPGRGQRYFPRANANSGFLVLSNQFLGAYANMFNGNPKDFVVRITKPGSTSGFEQPVNFFKKNTNDSEEKVVWMLSWQMPKDALAASTIYKIEIVRKAPIDLSEKMGKLGNQASLTKAVSLKTLLESKNALANKGDLKVYGNQGQIKAELNSATLNSRTFGSTIPTSAKDQSLYTFYFRTSKYDTPKEKLAAIKPVIDGAKSLVPYMNLKKAAPIVKFESYGNGPKYAVSYNWEGATGYSQEDADSKKFYGFVYYNRYSDKYYKTNQITGEDVLIGEYNWPPAASGIPASLPLQTNPEVIPYTKAGIGKLVALEAPSGEPCSETSAQYLLGEPFDEYDKKNLSISDVNGGTLILASGFVKGLTPLGTEPKDYAQNVLTLSIQPGNINNSGGQYANQSAGLVDKKVELKYVGYKAVPVVMTVGRYLYWSKKEADKFFDENPFGYTVGTSEETTIGTPKSSNAGSGNNKSKYTTVVSTAPKPSDYAIGNVSEQLADAANSGLKNLWKGYKP